MPQLEIALGGTYARLRGGGGAQCGGGLRGQVHGFTRQSRKRFMDFLNMIVTLALASGLFVTLTYPDVFPERPRRWKRDIDVFLKRAKRRYPRSVWVWRLEWKTRLSGQNVGKVAPHFHLLALGIPRLSLRWLAQAWYETVGSGDLRHLENGTHAQRIGSRRGVLWYAAKYIGKIAEDVEPGWTGRVWGVVGRDLLEVVLVRVELSWAQFYRLRRVLRGWLERKIGRRAGGRLRGQGITAYLDDTTSGRLAAWALVPL